jgi:hypothetical protein
MRATKLSIPLLLIAGMLACEPGDASDSDAGDQSKDPDTDVTDDSDDTDPPDDTDDATSDHAISATGTGSVAIPDGGDYFDTTANGIVPYSFSRHVLDIRNDSSEDVTIDSVLLTPTGDTLDIEWTLIDPSISLPTEIDVSGTVIGPGEVLETNVYFYPIIAGSRVEQVDVTYDGGKVYSFTVTGRGRDAWSLSDAGINTVEKVHGDPDADTLAGGSDIDEDDNLYYSGNANEWSDGFSENIVVSRMNADGSLAWTREWHEDYQQESPDPGQNGETGGASGSLDYDDGAVYVVGKRSQSSYNSVHQSLVMRIDSASGDMDWAVGWSPDNVTAPSVAWQSSIAYAVDASLSDRVIVTGGSYGESEVSLIALDKADGSMIWAKQLDVAEGYNDRGYGVKVDSSGNAYVVGLTSGRGFIARFEDVDGNAPTLDWVNKVDMGTGSNLNSVDIDSNDNAYVAMDRRGAATFLSVARFDTDGSMAWAKTWDDANSNDQNNSHVVRVDRDKDIVYLGGRVAFATGDTQFGEGFLMGLNTADGSYDWGMAYYSGKGAEEVMEHRLKGVNIDSNGDLRLHMHSYAVSVNFDHYWGYWYNLMDDPLADLTLGEVPGDGSALLVDYAPVVTDVMGDVTFHDSDGGYNGSNVATVNVIDTSSVWQDPPSSVVYEELVGHEGNGVDGDNVLMVFER